ncbi:hypothetical protein [Metamycoplasma equirhinis]|uniref:hypothetical protein n=1 Tax=Metamycoplasma equirhinis TaxID=92402 RepID=UPI003592FAB1
MFVIIFTQLSTLILFLLTFILSIKKIRYNYFINDTLEFLLENKKHMNISLQGYFTRFKIIIIFDIISLVLALSNMIFIIIKGPENQNIKIVLLLYLTFFTIIILLELIYLVSWYFKITKQYKRYNLECKNNNCWEEYYLSIDKLNLINQKYEVIFSYFTSNEARICKRWDTRYVWFSNFPTYQKMQKIFLKIKTNQEKINYINNLMFSKPLVFELNKTVLDREQLSLLYYKLLECVKKGEDGYEG